MPINGENLAKLEQLCRSSIEVGIGKLCEIGTWPRPPSARNLRVGYDFNWNVFQDIQEVNNLIQHLASDDKIKSIYFQSSSEPELHILHDHWERLLLKILRETEGTSPTNYVFRKWFRRFIKEIYSDTAVWRSIDTITGLILNEAEFKFDNTTVLTSTPAHRWLDIIWREQQYDARHDWFGSGQDKATIITTVSIPKHKYAGWVFPHEHLIKRIKRHLSAIDAIRLAKAGVPRLHCHAQFQISDFPLSDPLAYQDREGEGGLYKNETVLDRSDFKTIRTIWHERMGIKDKRAASTHIQSNAMDTAFVRFSRTYGKQNWFDDITDLTIALESLFNPTDKEELKHRVSLRAAWLLDLGKQAPDVNNRTYNIVRTMYDIRSSRVHGRTPEPKDVHKWIQTLSGVEYEKSRQGKLLELAMESARDIVRKSIAACAKLSRLKGDGPCWPFPDNFDENIVIAGQRRVWQKAAGIKK